MMFIAQDAEKENAPPDGELVGLRPQWLARLDAMTPEQAKALRMAVDFVLETAHALTVLPVEDQNRRYQAALADALAVVSTKPSVHAPQE
jgi:hypothetical protein